MTFAGKFFTEEIERQSRYNVLQIEVSFASTRRDSDPGQRLTGEDACKYLDPFWL